jgi:PAS domain S-box-containing protein
MAVGSSRALQKPEGAQGDSQLDDITHLACALCQAPVALVCSRDQQGWRLSHNSGNQSETLSFDLAFYTFAVTQRRAFEIGDLRSDPSFSSSPLVLGAPHFRFFAGFPVTSQDNQLLGAICILDNRTRALTTAQRQGMEALGRQVRAHLLHQQSEATQRVAQAEAREQQRQWRRVFESASIGMAEVNADGNWMQVNGTFCATLGYSVSEMLETRPRDLIHPDDLNSSESLLRKALAGEIPSCSGEKRLIHKTGKCVWCSIHVTLVRDAAGHPAYFLAHIVDISEMRQAQEGWRNAELRAQALMDLPAPVGIMTTDELGNITFTNRFVEQMTGYTAAELTTRRPIASLFLDSELREHSQTLARYFGAITHGAQTILEHARSSGPETREWTWLRKDGSSLRVSLTVTAMRNAQNAATGFALAALPAGKASDDAAPAVQSRFSAIADSAPIGMFLIDAHGNCSYVNEAFHQITGFGAAETSGQGWYGVFAAEERTPFYNEFQKAMRRGSDFCETIKLARPGADAWARVRGREIFFEDVAQGYVGTLEEITGSHLFLENLKTTEEKLRTVLTTAPFPVALLDRDRKCVMASVGWLDLHHRSWQEVHGRNFFELVPEARERLEDLCRRALNGGSVLFHEQTVRLSEGGSAEWLRWNVFPWRARGEICGIGIFEERLTHQMRLLADAEAAREAAEAASRVKSEFLADVSAELRTPGAGIVGLVDILLENEALPERREFLEMIKTSTASWLKLAGDIYEFSRLESRKLELEILPFNFLDGLSQNLRRLSAAAESKNLELICQTSPELPTVVVGDGGRLFQILSHLVTFAIEMTAEGEISVSVDLNVGAERNPSLHGALGFHFTVRDSSGSLSDDKFTDINQVLLMVENSPALKKIGTNLSLVLSARLINLMGGKLWLEREKQGVAFHFILPLSGKRQVVAPVPLLADRPILIVEKNLTHRKWLQQTLAAWGMKVTVLEKPSAVIDVLEIAHDAGRPFRFALLDARLPHRDLFASASQIKANPRTSAVTPVMLLSAARRPQDEARARELGLDAFVIKPVNPNELRETLERCLGGVPEEPTAMPNAPKRFAMRKPKLNVLLVDDSRLNQEVAMGVLGQEGHRLTVARNGREAAAILERRACDMVLLGLDMPGENSLETLATIRQREKESQKQVRVFGMTAQYASDPALKEITDGFLPNPIQPKDLTRLLEQLRPELE